MGKRLILLLTAVIIIALPLSGCKTELVGEDGSNPSAGGSESSLGQQETVFHKLTLPYDAKDSLDPFTSKTLANTSLIPVLYDGLFRINEKYQAEPVIAQEIKQAGTAWTVTLRSGIQFSDGSRITGEDVVYSWSKARAAARYRDQLANITSVSVPQKASGTVVFQLQEPDPLFVNLLTFPIVKKDSKTEPPVGSGRYTAVVEANSAKLVYNQKHFRGTVPEQLEIPLKSMPDDEAILSGIKTGTMSAVFSDLSSGELSSAGALSTPVPLNNMVYLGINASRAFLSEPAVRQAIACAIDRGTVFFKGFSGMGSLASVPMHPLVAAEMELSAQDQITYDLANANQLLDGAGYREKNAQGYRLLNGEPITLELLVNGENSFKKLAATQMKEMLAAVGIQVTVKEESFSAYQSAVEAGSYDLYIGEMKLLNNMSLDVLLSGSTFLAGTRSEALLSAYRSYRDGSGKYADFIRAFNEEVPFVPLLFRSGILIYNRNIKSEIKVSATDIYYNLEEWK